MKEEIYGAIWDSTLGQTLFIPEQGSTISNGLSEETSVRYESAAYLSDDEMWKLIKDGKL